MKIGHNGPMEESARLNNSFSSSWVKFQNGLRDDKGGILGKNNKLSILNATFTNESTGYMSLGRMEQHGSWDSNQSTV